MIRILSILLLLFLTSCTYHIKVHEWDKTDKILYGAVVAAQVFDGITTHNHLKGNPNNYIIDTWSWKYPSNKPSSGEIISIKLTELIIALLVAELLPQDMRKIFLIGTVGTLTYYGMNNLR